MEETKMEKEMKKQNGTKTKKFSKINFYRQLLNKITILGLLHVWAINLL